MSERGEIISFYSYKGGTGRTMALANVACLLAEQIGEAERVLVVDWDLEAPGLHRFFPSRLSTPQTLDAGLDAGPGLIDLFLDIEKALPSSAPTTDESVEAAVSDALGRVDVDRVITDTIVPNVQMLRAGRNDDGQYSTRVGTFNWESLFRRAPTVYQAFAERLARTYRYVLIDSRTGVTDISGICTTLLPEKLVVVFTPNRQSLTGVRELVERATAYRKNSDDLRPLVVFPLPSRIEASLEDLRAKWRFGDRDLGIVGYQPMFEGLFKQVYGLPSCDLAAYFNDVQIQQTPDYAYGEEIAVRRHSDRFSLANSYRVFVQRLVSGAPPWTQPAVAVSAPVTQESPASERPAPVPLGARKPTKPAASPARSASRPPAASAGQATVIRPPSPVAPEPKEKKKAPSGRPQVFLSYAAADREQARQLADSLQALDLKVWHDYEEIRPGSEFSAQIERALDASDVVVVLWSKASTSSQWVMAEAEEGLRRGVLLPVLLDDVSPPLGFRQIQALDLRRDRERGVELLYEAINRIAHVSPGDATLLAAQPALQTTGPTRRLLLVWAALLLLLAIALGIAYRQTSSRGAEPTPTAEAPVRVPNFVGAQTADVQRTAALLQLRLVMSDKIGREFESLSGVVTSQNPPPDTELPKGGTVRIQVETSVVAVPTLTGTSLDYALNALVRVGLKLGTTETRIVTDAADGTIVTQSPAPGTMVPLGARVDVTVARRPSTTTAPKRPTTVRPPLR